ncbi:MAG: hypothetical protein IJU36_03800 [Paludibacteraceae bacterium]|nr:hypothetical protein [Paludibacteraceae bacterium]
MKHYLLFYLFLWAAVTLQAQSSVGQSTIYSPYAQWESADSAIARQNGTSFPIHFYGLQTLTPILPWIK